MRLRSLRPSPPLFFEMNLLNMHLQMHHQLFVQLARVDWRFFENDVDDHLMDRSLMEGIKRRVGSTVSGAGNP